MSSLPRDRRRENWTRKNELRRNPNTKRRKRVFNFVWKAWKFWWNESDDEILPVFAQNLFTLKFIFSCSRGKLFSVLLQANIYVFILKKM